MKKLGVLLQVFLLFALLSLFLLSQWKYVNKTAYYFSDKADSSSIIQSEEGDFRINLNEADFDTLMSIPGMSKKIANAILNHREQYGNFIYPEDIIYVKGIGEKTLEKIISFFYVE